jgi:hypothetical protein
MGERGRQVFAAQQGATGRALDAILAQLNPQRSKEVQP